MSYRTVAICTEDEAFTARVTACIADEQQAKGDDINPGAILFPIVWAIATASDVEAAYASALAASNPDPGGDESVITDGMILANVQASWPPDP